MLFASARRSRYEGLLLPFTRRATSSSTAVAMLLLAGGGLLPAARAASGPVAGGVFELTRRSGPKTEATQNPYREVNFSAWFFQDGPSREVVGFYDGNRTFRIRFMPPVPGTWHYTTVSSLPELEGVSGDFVVAKSVVPPASKVLPQVRVVPGQRGFSYADGRPFEARGTTVPAAMLAGDEAQHRKTLKMLADGGFNKVRLSVLPGNADEPRTEPPAYPFPGKPGHFELGRFNPGYFQRLERWIAELGRHGVEAELVLFHGEPDAGWGLDAMTADDEAAYVRYVVARLAAFHNVWWSIVDGWAPGKGRSEGDLDRLGKLVAATDPYHHPISVESGGRLFDYKRPWITHVSLSADAAAADATAHVAASFGKPVVIEAPALR